MKKQIKRFKVDFNFNWRYGVSIEQIRKDLDELEKIGVTEIDIEPEQDYDMVSVSINAFVERLETDEELNNRVEKEKKRKKEIQDRELAELNRLKSKYES